MRSLSGLCWAATLLLAAVGGGGGGGGGGGAAAAAAAGETAAPAPLDLEVFEDDDCREAPDADVLLSLMHDLADLLDRVLFESTADIEADGDGAAEGEGDALAAAAAAWQAFEAWQSEHIGIMAQLAGSVFARPYCEPGKVAWMASECLVVLRRGAGAAGDGGGSGPEEALTCAEALDEDFLTQMTPRGTGFVTRLHLMLRSAWPALRLLDLLVRLHPERGSTRMGACRRFLNWRSDPDVFDWPWFKLVLGTTVDAAMSGPGLLALRPEDGPLSRQYRARWLRTHQDLPLMREAITFSDDVFESYREHHYKAGCHLGVISCYVLQALLVHLRDVEGRLHRQLASVAQLINLHAPFPHMVKSDWPVFRLLHIASLLQRVPPNEVWEGADGEPVAPPDAARRLAERVEAAAADTFAEHGPDSFAFVTTAWGHLARFAGYVLRRWAAVLAGERIELIFLALDAEALAQCEGVERVRCIDAPRRLGVEGAVAKYLALAAVARLGATAVWLDLDVYVAADPSPYIRAALDDGPGPELLFARHATTESVSPAVVVVRGSAEATEMVVRYAGWLRENPFLLDHQGWDHFLDNRAGDFAGGFDYQGRNVSVKDDKGPSHSFLPEGGIATGARYGKLGDEFGSGDGWFGEEGAAGLALFHFWGAAESQKELFELFYPHSLPGFPKRSREMLARYRRKIVSSPTLPAMIGNSGVRGAGGGRPLHLVAVSYADGCCRQSLRKNRRQALAVGADEARSYGRADLGPDWAARNEGILSQKKGGGWWLWKPYVILRALRDPAVPWHRGAVLWVDAGNFLHADPRGVVAKALAASDVSALRLKYCLESDWTSAVTLRRLNVSGRYNLVDGPQIGAYFLMFRKTELAIAFVEEWLRLAEDAMTLTGIDPDAPEQDPATTEVPGFQKHQADQSIFSILFKQRGFRAASLEEGHQVVTLARWRE